MPQFHPAVLAAGQVRCAGLYLVPLSLVLDAPWTLEVRMEHLGGIAWIAIVATGIPTLLPVTPVRVVGATVASLMAFFMPVAALILGIVTLGEEPGGGVGRCRQDLILTPARPPPSPTSR